MFSDARPPYATLEMIESATDIASTARARARVARALGAASERADGQLRRRFYPKLTTRLFDWPDVTPRGIGVPSYSLWLESNEMISLSSLNSGGTAISTSNATLRRGDDLDEPPYTRLELSLASSAAFSSGSTFQRSLSVTGVFGYRLDEEDCGTASAVGTTSTVSLNLASSKDYSQLGTGSLLRIDSERLLVTSKGLLTTGATITTSPAASPAATSIGVSSTTAFVLGETITVDSERMRVDDIAGSNLIVSRGVDGSVLAAHTSGATVYAPRALTVQRGVLGSTAATHSGSATVHLFQYPDLVRDLTIAETLIQLEGETSKYARTVGTGEGQRNASFTGIKDIRAQAWRAYGLKHRPGAI